MKELGTTPEELSETRIPSTPQTDTFPVHCELLASHETLPPPSLEQSSILETPDSRTPAIQCNPSKDVGTILAPEALAALRAHFQVQGVPPVGSQSRRKHPVLKTNTGSFLVAPNPPPPLSPVPQIPRSLVNRPPRPPDPVLFTTPERRISVQSPTPALLVQAGAGQYQILGRTNNERPGLNQSRILDSRMLPIEMKSNQNHPIPQPSTTVLQNPASCSTPLTPKLQTGKILHQELTHSLMERSALPVPLNLPSTSTTLAAAVENLKSQFLNGDIKLTQDFQKSDSAPFQDLQKSDPGHKRRKTSFKDSLSLPFYSTPLNGLELLLQAAKLAGDDLPEDLEDDRSPRIFCPPFGSTLGSFVGVYPLLDGSFIARCRYKGCYVPIGSFNSAELAARAYDRVVLGLRGRKAKTNYSPTEYLGFELENARRALDTKYKQCHQTRRGSAWPWARAAQTLLINEEDGTTLLSNSCHDYVLNNVPELVQNVAPLTEALPGNSVFELLQTVMSKKRDLNGTFDLIQRKIRQLQQRIQSGLSTEEECNCVGQYACVASILSSLVSMQKEWERRNSNFESDSLLAKGELLDPSSFSEPSRKPNSRIVEESDSRFPKQSVSEGNSRDFTHARLNPFSSKNIPSSSFQEPPPADCDHSKAGCLREEEVEVPSMNEDRVDESSAGGGGGGGGNGPPSKTDVDSCPYTESIRWVRLLASSLWPRKRGGGMLWKAYQPLFKSSHHRHSILKLREELFLRPDDHVGGSQSEGGND